MEVTIRPEMPLDYTTVASVNERAFGQPHEARLVERLRDCAEPLLSLVADSGGQVVGHALFSPVHVEGAGSVHEAMALGPVAVDPDHQRQGVGSALIRRGIELLGKPAPIRCSFSATRSTIRGSGSNWRRDTTSAVSSRSRKSSSLPWNWCPARSTE